MHADIRGNIEQRLRVVEDDLRACADERVRGVLSSLGRNGDDADDDVPLAEDFGHIVDRADPQVTDALSDLLRIGLEDRGDSDSVLAEDGRARNGAPEPARSEEGDVVLALRSQDLANFVEQRFGAVAHSTLAELAERRQIAPNLGRVDVRVLRDLLRGDSVLPHLPRLTEHLQVPAQASGDTNGQAFGHVLPLSTACNKTSRFCQRRLDRRRRNCRLTGSRAKDR